MPNRAMEIFAFFAAGIVCGVVEEGGSLIS
jgi:hypothetical protein